MGQKDIYAKLCAVLVFQILCYISDESYAVSIDKDPLVVPDGPITQSRAKKIKEAMAGLVQSTQAELAHSPSKASTFKIGFKEEEPALIHVIQAKEELAQHIKGLDI